MLAVAGLLAALLVRVGGTPAPAPAPAPTPAPAPIYLRIRVMTTKERHEDVNQSVWQLPNHTATDVLNIIRDVKPTMLERYFSGRVNLTAPVPVSRGAPPMTVGEFLNASMSAGASGCTIMPRVSLYEFLDKQQTLLDTAAHLRALPLDPPLTALGLDNWGNFQQDPRYNESVVRGLFGSLLDMGWKDLSINTVGGLGKHGAFGMASMADFGTKTGAPPGPGAVGAVPNWAALAKLEADPSITSRLLYIDFSAQMLKFMHGSTADEMAAAIVDALADNGAQRERGYSFVYPVVQSFFDSTALSTTVGGRWGGRSLYRVMCENIRAAVADRPPAQQPACALY